MTNSSLAERIIRGSLLSDGAMGTELYAAGVNIGPIELANLEKPDLVKSIHRSYLQSGSELIQTNTFGANASRLAIHGISSQTEELNRLGVALARDAIRLTGQQAWVAGAMGPLAADSFAAEILGSATAHNVFAEQASILTESGVDVLVLETFTSLAQLRLALAAVRSVSNLPVMATLTFNNDGLTPAGDAPEEIATSLSEENLIAIGANCSIGPDLLRSVIERMSQNTNLPLLAQPNAGLPSYVDGQLQYTAESSYFAEVMKDIVSSGATILGGCCGTTPRHIAAVRDGIKGITPQRKFAKPAQILQKPSKHEEENKKPTGLAEKIIKGEFVVTVELSPPRGFDISDTVDKLREIAGHIDAVNVADSPRAQGRMSALATGSLIQSKLGIESIMHAAIRHRNLLALHSDLLGAHALGIRNVFTVMGDVPQSGDYPQATAVSDVTASGLIRLMSGFNNGVDANGREIDSPTSFFIGAAFNFNAPDIDRELKVLDRKVAAGANFLLTQPIYSIEQFDRVYSILGEFPIPIILGVLPLRNTRHALFLHNEVPGILVPDQVVNRLNQSGEKSASVGIEISRELLQELSGKVAGAYFMPPFERFNVVKETLDGLDL
ncbi:MAG: bifunctional homocysteine S-methyltransferase/methylenetetrahydrofolate reductase [SAR202 cluster bacterium]|nr:bifunctional homocysteine S-methyltransferase/methylenetetrahydrofolate reductase [SAR202 cluster bacterium]|tara:strand:- start:2384 stop:4216 length:1833 start_codon:yes stop_codon:yes gene_type:complete